MAGSLGYAGRLKNKKNLGGQLGATEYIEDVETVREKVESLAGMITDAHKKQKKVFFFTGAGISTAIGIPDFRGPNGIWTLKKKKRPITAPLTPFEHAKPSFTHMVIAAMLNSGYVSMICSQNVDSLHLRSGIPRKVLAELHGNCFAERCSKCKHERVRDFQVETLGFNATGRTCNRPGCGGGMIDNVLDWESELPDDELDDSLTAAEEAGVCMVLGSSLQIAPANEIPLFTSNAGGKMIIVNLQKTPRDRNASLILRARVDAVMALLALQLHLHIPPFARVDGVVLCHAPATPPTTAPTTAPATDTVKSEAKHESESEPGVAATSANGTHGESVSVRGPWGFRLLVRSAHGERCMLPMVRAVGLKVEAASTSNTSNTSSSGSGSGGEVSIVGTATVLSVGCAEPVVPASQQHAGVDDTPDASEDPAADAADPPTTAPTTTTDADGFLTTPTPKSSGGVPLGGPYEFGVSGIDPSVTSVRCTVRLHLTEWADPDKQTVTLPAYEVTRDTCERATGTETYPTDESVAAIVDGCSQLLLPGQAPADMLADVEAANANNNQQPTANGAAENGHAAAPPPKAAVVACGPLARVVARGERFAVCAYVSQALQYSAEGVWEEYKRDPPPVVAQPPPRKRQKSDAETAAMLENAGALRRSGRARRATAKSRDVSQDPDESDSEE